MAPMGPNQSLTTDELIDILLFATPRSWQREMSRQGFDPMNHDLNTIVSFMERLEETEDFEHKQPPVVRKASPAKYGKRKQRDGPFCLVHGYSNHTSDNCKLLQHQAKKLKTHLTNKPDTPGHYKNLTWNRKEEVAKDKSKKELHAFVEDQIKKGVLRELATYNKKQKVDEMMAVDAQPDLKNDSSEDEDFNDLNSLMMADAIKQETDSSDDELV